jgi:hypothetical protein
MIRYHCCACCVSRGVPGQDVDNINDIDFSAHPMTQASFVGPSADISADAYEFDVLSCSHFS